MVTKYTTHSSTWIVDDSSKMITRMPRLGEGEGNGDHPYFSYEKVGTPSEYTRVFVHANLLWFEMADGRSGRSGDILKIEEL